uniref:Abelson helper integration site 1 n=1 Tax=Rousettus aegyptiacus TaxID=9407 RepID=A0A7J8K4K0_ROUAE|nr:Abelson helper integration site 1 [Rousettus aegyptiacus]
MKEKKRRKKLADQKKISHLTLLEAIFRKLKKLQMK